MLLLTFAIFSNFVNECKPIRSPRFYTIATTKKTYSSVQALFAPPVTQEGLFAGYFNRCFFAAIRSPMKRSIMDIKSIWQSIGLVFPRS
jgi:hypothetical protein